MSDDSDFQYSDDDMDDTNHAKLVENVLKLNKSQNLKKPSRTEPTLQISEFNLVKSVTGQKGTVEIADLTKILKTKKKHAVIGQKVETTKKKTHTLPKPLEKPQAERIRRTVGYEKNRFLFDRWEAFVTSNRASAHQVFPLDSVENLKIESKKAADFSKTWTYKSDLQKELEKIDTEVYKIEDEPDKNEFPLTLEELKEKRQEAAKLRAHQRYKEAKARRQNKIKSKKYHRILRKEKIKQKLKEFEELQKTNPEEALKKLEEIEKARALERFSLRHKGTGQWAKSKQVRAKYDKESRQVLAQQLAISRELTQKQQNLEESESEEEKDKIEENFDHGDNPWIGKTKPNKEVLDFVSGYKKYWNEQNGKEIAQETITDEQEKEKIIKDKVANKKKPTKQKVVTKAQKKLNNSSGDWDIEEIFDKAEKKVEEKLKKKLTKKTKNKTKPKNKKKITKKIDLTMPSQSKKQMIDEELNETTQKSNSSLQTSNNNIEALKNILNVDTKKSEENINPEKFLNKVTNLDTELPSLITEDDNEENNQKNIIMEAFEDNDITEDFSKEKQQEIDKDKPQDIDLNLPGWGSWAGTGINPKKQRKRKRFIIKMPEKMPRRDDNKGLLIINEKAAAKIKPHLVSEVPFPFKTVKDYEASIRAPIGNTFVPELAFRRFIKPTVETKMGSVIEPATTSILMGKPKK